MTALLPPPGGPLPQAARVRELLAAARERLEIARERLQKVIGYAADPQASDVEQQHTRILLAVRDVECELWAAEVARLEQLADRMRPHPTGTFEHHPLSSTRCVCGARL